MNKKLISAFAINLKSRADRRKFILSQFKEREEFRFFLVEAHKHDNGAVGLWITIRQILKDLVQPDDEYIILCQDDHLFTQEYSKEHLLYCIDEARSLHADILSCGVSGFTTAINVSQNLYWVEKFSGLQFTVVFRKFFRKILDAGFENINAADLKLCELTENKFFIYPFLSIQKEFGYSDITYHNNAKGIVEQGFRDSYEKVKVINAVSTHYQKKFSTMRSTEDVVGLENVVLPTFIIAQKEEKKTHNAVINQFSGRYEFDVTIIEAFTYEAKEPGTWLGLKNIIKTAIENDEDVIIVCRENHQFTKHYRFSNFIKLIYQAGLLGCNILVGGVEAFNLALPITTNVFWIDSFWSSKLIVIYNSFYRNILEEPFCDSDTLEGKFSEMTSNKMVIHPFISEDAVPEIMETNKKKLRTSNTLHVKRADERIAELKKAWNKFGNQIHSVS